MTIISQYYEINISKIFKLEIVTGPCIASPRFGFLRECAKKKKKKLYVESGLEVFTGSRFGFS